MCVYCGTSWLREAAGTVSRGAVQSVFSHFLRGDDQLGCSGINISEGTRRSERRDSRGAYAAMTERDNAEFDGVGGARVDIIVDALVGSR